MATGHLVPRCVVVVENKFILYANKSNIFNNLDNFDLKNTFQQDCATSTIFLGTTNLPREKFHSQYFTKNIDYIL